VGQQTPVKPSALQAWLLVQVSVGATISSQQLKETPDVVGQQSPANPLHAGFAEHSGAAIDAATVRENTKRTFVETIDMFVN